VKILKNILTKVLIQSSPIPISWIKYYWIAPLFGRDAQTTVQNGALSKNGLKYRPLLKTQQTNKDGKRRKKFRQCKKLKKS
jgi:hypothetical protein